MPPRLWQWDGRLHRLVLGQIGLSVEPIPQSSPYTGQTGVAVANVYGPLSTRAAAALQVGAIIQRANGVRVTNPALLALIVERIPIGHAVRLQGVFNSVPFNVRVPVRVMNPIDASVYRQIHVVYGTHVYL